MKKTLTLLLLLAGLSVEAQGRTLTWTGAENDDWKFWDVTNWVDESGTPTVYQNGDDVVFNDNGAWSVYVWSVSPGNILVENNSGHKYHFEGVDQGYIGGPGGLTKKGEGSLTIDNIRHCTCDYAGSTDIYGGSIRVTYVDEKYGETFDVWLGKDVIHLYGGALHVDYGTLRNNIIVDGTATLYCRDLGGTLTFCDSSKLTLTGNLTGRGGDVILQDGAMVNVGGYTVYFYGGTGTEGLIKVDGNATLGNGLISACKLNVAAGKTLTLLENTSATFGTNFNLGEGATLDMGGNSVSFADTTISSSGDGGYLGHGTIEGDLTVTSGSRINLLENTTITGGVNLGDNASLDLGKNAISANTLTFNGDSATIGNGTINGNLAVAEGKSLALLANTTVTGGVSLGAKSSLNLGGNTVTGAVTLSGSATIGNGAINGDMTVAADDTLTLCGNLSGTGTIYLGDLATLDMGGFTLDKDVSLSGGYWGATIGNGTLNGDVFVTTSKSNTKNLNLSSDLSGEGSIYLSDNTGLALNWHTLTNNVFVSENATAYINGGTLNGNMNVAAGATLSVNSGNVDGKGSILLGEGAKLNLGNYKVSNDVALGGKTASIGNGKLGGNLAVGEGQTLTLSSNRLALTGGISLGYNATLDLGGKALSNSVTLDGISASIGNGAIESNLLVGNGKTLSLSGNLSGTGTISLGDYAALNLGTHELSANVSVDGGHATLGNGAIESNLLVGSGKTLSLSGNLSGTGTISLQANATLDLDGHSLSSGLTSNLSLGSASSTIGNGTIVGDLTATYGLTLLENTSVTGVIKLGQYSTLDLGGNTFYMSLQKISGNCFFLERYSSSLSVANGTLKLKTSNEEQRDLIITLGEGAALDLQQSHFLCLKVKVTGDASIGAGRLNGLMTVDAGSKLTLCGDLLGYEESMDGRNDVALNNNATLDLNGHTLAKLISLNGNTATIGNGIIECDQLIVPEDYKLTLLAGTSITGYIQLNEGSALDLGGNTFHVGGENGNRIHLYDNTATIGNGSLDGDHTMEAGQSLNLCGDLGGSGTIILKDSATLNLGTHTLSKDVSLNGASTVTADKTTIKALNADKEGLLKELSVSDGLIAGTDRQASLADGLDISRMGYDLTMENLVLTANNSISVGNGHSITLNNVTIKLSQAHYELVDGSYYFNLKTLINCDLDMDTVTFDASGLSLGTAMEKVVFDFGEDVNIDSATRARLQLDEAWDGQAYITGPGLLVFSKSAPIPEPATGTLSLLALAALAARRRRK